ncbi:MAG: hypothetical protein LWW94_10825 [Candidatus Desulfofervidaceae bacterium]|nr:hypothetical protein [Candidatus Desulfofervidaceae bacterium]
MENKRPFPPFIIDLPEIDISLKGVEGRLFQGLDKQLVFFTLDAGTEVPPHKHRAQWGIVIEGKLVFTPKEILTISPQVEHAGRACETKIAFYTSGFR